MGDGSGSNSHDFYSESSSEEETDYDSCDKETLRCFQSESPEIVEEPEGEIFIKELNVDI